ncbi:hypothetical protein PG991_010249 [Apiospora marii]|uniref:NACHT domain-containing protein n=1 Tax=Apiospora marii TaxID=335849 RepID=A0ABR1RJZ5_9PEZI
MADPLSVAASIAGLVTLADIILDRLTTYVKSVKNAEKESRQLVREMIVLRGLLDTLSRLADSLETERFDNKFGSRHLDACKTTLTEIFDTLRDHSNGTTARNMIWPFKARRIKELHEELSRHKDTINLALSANSMEAILKLLAYEEAHTAEIITAIKDTSKITSRIREDTERQKVLDYYLTVNPQSNYDMSIRLHHTGTGLWLIRLPKFQDWISAPSSMLWLKGIPGAGKTVLAGVIIGEALAKSTETTATAFFFCDYKSGDTHKVENILRALAYQLAIQKEEAYEKLDQHFQLHNPSPGMPKTPTVQSLSDLLQDMIKLFDRVYLIVDGIDECGPLADAVLETLIAITETTRNVSMALLSRDEAHIRDWLEGACASVEIAAHNEDVTEYVRAQLGERLRTRKLRIDDPGLKEEILVRLVEGAKGMFRWVACQLDQLAFCDSDQECRDALNTLPPTLDETYVRILHRVPKHKARMVVLALNCIAYAYPRLSIMQLRELLSMPETGNKFKPSAMIREDSIMKYCSSLVRKSANESFLEFSHFSVQEFLNGTFDGRPDLAEFRISEDRAYKLLAVDYLRYLQLDNFKDLPSGASDILEYVVNLNSKFSLYSIASSRWANFAALHWGESQIMSLAKSLFHPKTTALFISWALNLLIGMQGIPSGGFMVSKERIVAILTDTNFTPLHLAAALSMPEICSYLLEHDLNANLKSLVGNPMQCAVQGLLAFHDSARGDPLLYGVVSDGERHPVDMDPFPFRYRGGSDTITLRDTINSLQKAGATLQFACFDPFPGESLIGVAFKSARNEVGLLLPMILLEFGADLDSNDVDYAEKLFNVLRHNESYDEETDDENLCLFIEGLATLKHKSPAHLRLYWLAWREAVHYKLDFVFNSTATEMATNTSELAFAAVRLHNAQALQKIVRNSNLQIASLKDHDGNSLLHPAMVPTQENPSLEIIEFLLKSRCNPRAINDAGEQPMHVWSQTEAGSLDVAHQTARLLTEHGAECSYQNLEGSTSLHLVAKYPHQLKALLKYQSVDCILRAMKTTDAEGYTPFSRSLQEQYVQSAVILAEHVELNSAMVKSPTPVLLLAAYAGSEQLFELLARSNIQACHYDPTGRSPLHCLGPSATEAFVLRLKSYYPTVCDSHVDEGPPMRFYLEACFNDTKLRNGEHTKVDMAVMRQLYTTDIPQFSIWETFSSNLLPAAISLASGEIPPGLGSQTLAAGAALLELGYLESYEKTTMRCGIFLLLESIPCENWWITFKLVGQIKQRTLFWTEFCESKQSIRLLKAAIRGKQLVLMKLLLDEGISVHQRDEGQSVLEHFACEVSYNDPTTKKMLKMLANYMEQARMNEAGTNGEALIHLPKDVGGDWMVQFLVQREQIRTYALKTLPKLLLLFTIYPCRADYLGWDAPLAASVRGAVQFLEELYCTDETLKRIDWERSCITYVHKIEHKGVNGLHLAALGGHVAVLKFYLKHGLIGNLEATCDGGFRPLHYAAMHGHLRVIQLLCLEGSDINATGNDGSTALHFAAKHGHCQVAKYLLQKGCRPTFNMMGWSPLLYAHQAKNKEFVEHLQSVDFNFTGDAQDSSRLTPDSASASRNKATARAIEKAIKQDSLPLFQQLYSNVWNLDTCLPNCGWSSPLIQAIIDQRLSIIKWLLEKNVSMMAACHIKGYTTSVHLLIGTPTLNHLERNKGHYAKVNGIHANHVLSMAVNERTPTGTAPIHIAAVALGSLEAIDLLLGMGADINTRDHRSDSPLLATIQYCNMDTLKIVTHLIANGASIEQRGDNNLTPLMVACSRGLPHLVAKLLEAEADTSVIDHQFRSLLHIAASAQQRNNSDHCRIFAILLQQGLDIHSLKGDGWSALHLASIFRANFTSLLMNMDLRLEGGDPLPWTFMTFSGNSRFGVFLKLARRKYRHDVLERFINVSPCNAWSPLCLAAASASMSIMDNLLGIGAQLDKEGCPLGSALMVACEFGRKESVTFLTRRGAALSYSGPSGFRSAYTAAQKFPDILSWLLVDRFTDQAKLTDAPTTPDGLRDGDLYDVSYTWGGPIQVELVITGVMERQPKESLREYWTRLMREKKACRGKVVPQSPGRRTTRDLNLWPKEYVQIHPDGYEVKQ